MGVLVMFSRNGHDPAIKYLGEAHAWLSVAEKEFVKIIGVPVCMPNCGKCCEINSITIKGIEARYISNWLKKQKTEVRNRVLEACRKWLFEKFEKVGTRYGFGTTRMPPHIIDQLNQEVVWLAQKSGCPMLAEDKTCLIHPVRPLVCQAYGVTRIVPLDVCNRPIGKIEKEGYRAFINNSTTDKVKDNIEKMKSAIEGSSYINTQGFIATMILLEMEPQKLFEYAYHNDVESAKLVQLGGGHFLWQEQLNENWDREAEIRMLVNPMTPSVGLGEEPSDEGGV